MTTAEQPKSTAISFEINPALNRSALRRAFEINRRVQVASFLKSGAAQALAQHLSSEIEWSVVLVKDGRLFEVPPATHSTYSPVQEQQLAQLAYTEAKKGFSFLYQSNWRSLAERDSQTESAPSASLSAQLAAFLGSRTVLAFMSELTGVHGLCRSTAQATYYQPGHFLSPHTDANEDSARRIAYVLNLSRDWQAHWGGLLHFIDPDSNASEAYVPYFNSLNVFCVPQLHAVSMVSHIAMEKRLAITGWFYADV